MSSDPYVNDFESEIASLLETPEPLRQFLMSQPEEREYVPQLGDSCPIHEFLHEAFPGADFQLGYDGVNWDDHDESGWVKLTGTWAEYYQRRLTEMARTNDNEGPYAPITNGDALAALERFRATGVSRGN